MRTTWTIGKTLNLAFLAVAVIVLLLGATGFYGIMDLSKTTHVLGSDTLGSMKSLLTVGMVQNAIDSGENILMDQTISPQEREETYSRFAALQTEVESALKEFASYHEGGDEASEIRSFTSAWEAWWGAHETFVDLARELEKTDVLNPASLQANFQKFRADHLQLIRAVGNFVEKDIELKGGDDPTACNFGKFLASYKTTNNAINTALTEAKPIHEHFHACVKQIREQVVQGDKAAALLTLQNEQEPAADKVIGHFDAVLAEASKSQELYDKMASQMEINDGLVGKLVSTRDQLLDLNQEEAADTVRIADAKAARLETVSVVAMVGGVAMSLLLGVVISRRTNNALRKIASDLATGSQQTTSAAGQVSQSSQAMAAGASEQASSIEETSASLEEITSMTRQNADNAMQAKKLAEVANASAEKGAESMDRMGTAIIDIKKSSDETAKIIKSIDEIAFQTNLLALNAAVEAARAGDAGKGFAVVAEEVRNLAQRSAEAAKNTASMIETSVSNADRGVKISTEVGGSLKEISESVHKVNNLVGEIASASNEQARGIEQIGTAMNQLNQVTQTNAASSEQAAAAAEELGAQAEEMNRMVDQLRAMVGGANGNGAGHMHERRALAGPARRALPPAGRGHSVKVAKPENVIPLDDDDIKDF